MFKNRDYSTHLRATIVEFFEECEVPIKTAFTCRDFYQKPRLGVRAFFFRVNHINLLGPINRSNNILIIEEIGCKTVRRCTLKKKDLKPCRDLSVADHARCFCAFKVTP